MTPSTNFFLLKKFFYVFFPNVFQWGKNFFFIKPAYVLSKLKKNFGRHFVFSKFDQIRGGPPTSHFLTFQNFFWISFSRRILLVKHVGVYCASWLSYRSLKNGRLYVFEQFDQIWTLITFLWKMLDSIYKVDLLLRMAMKFFWYLDVTWHLQQNFFLLKKFFYVFFPMFFSSKIFFLLNQHTYYQI